MKMHEYENFINEVKLPATESSLPSVYAFSLHKSGSTLLFNMLADLAGYIGSTYFSLDDQLFLHGVKLNQKVNEVENFFKSQGYIYGGFRSLSPFYEIPNLAEHKKILLVRNPLDAMVSKYFSIKTSHILPQKGSWRDYLLANRKRTLDLSLDEYVIDNYHIHLKFMMSYLDILRHSNCRIFRYEDIIYSKKDFLGEICNFYGWEVDESRVAEIASKYDVFPEQEETSQHIRQVHPGNYKKYLAKDTQLFLGDKFEPLLEAYGYKLNAQNVYHILSQFQGGRL